MLSQHRLDANANSLWSVGKKGLPGSRRNGTFYGQGTNLV